ncbi:hypothetical protein EZV61_15125 [Corallincola luteus]|uniref:Uncharacterized protein n=1 Tax=Corallincola luteus TaxID=1775177 RepID=A0ABY2AJV6_9GAMM|nr:hypothetical protein [Corallincola luteus]TCI02260.1 hypothetical protein EZV61_15125 [Corallincola luteus]
MKIVLIWLVMVGGSICCLPLLNSANATNHGAHSGPGLIRFEKPMHQGYRLDWCLSWATKCGQPAASEWCKVKSYKKVNSWIPAWNVGGASHTKVFETAQICNQDFCDSFMEITCRSLESGVFFDFLDQAPKANWTSSWQKLPFPGGATDSRGFARYVDNAKLEDNRFYERVLQTHPQWRPHGRIAGRYTNITIPNAGADFRAEIGFLAGASGSDGAYFEIWAEFPNYSGIPLRREYRKNQDGHVINDFSQDLSRFRGLTGTIAITVNAGEKSSAQDWAVWGSPRLVSMKNEFKFGGFVGAAVGSKRQGDRLLNAWGGKSGLLYGNIVMHLAFAESDTGLDLPVQLISYYKGQKMGVTDLGILKANQKTMWRTLSRTQLGRWKEEIIYNGTYVGEIRYNISNIGE